MRPTPLPTAVRSASSARRMRPGAASVDRNSSGCAPVLMTALRLVPPRLRAVRTNTTWATQAMTLRDETLGSSTGEAQQVFRTHQAPVLLDQRLDVQEPVLPSVSEQEALRALAGDEAISSVRGEDGRDTIWVRWHAVADLYAFGPRDRHYVIDHLTGEIRFGDGQHGMIPPVGPQTIRMAYYRTGGGAQGNRPAGSITQLKAAIPAVAGGDQPCCRRGWGRRGNVCAGARAGPRKPCDTVAGRSPPRTLWVWPMRRLRRWRGPTS